MSMDEVPSLGHSIRKPSTKWLCLPTNLSLTALARALELPSVSHENLYKQTCLLQDYGEISLCRV